MKTTHLTIASAIGLSSFIVGMTDANAKFQEANILVDEHGKKVKGYQVFKSKLYYNGSLKKGLKLYKNILYKNGSKPKELISYKNKYYYNGKLANGAIKGKNYKKGTVVKVAARKDYTKPRDDGDKYVTENYISATKGVKLNGNSFTIPGTLKVNEVFLTLELDPNGNTYYIDERYYYTEKDGWQKDYQYHTLREGKSYYERFLKILPKIVPTDVGDELTITFDDDYNSNFDVLVVPNGSSASDVKKGYFYITEAELDDWLAQIKAIKPKKETYKAYSEATEKMITFMREIERIYTSNDSEYLPYRPVGTAMDLPKGQLYRP